MRELKVPEQLVDEAEKELRRSPVIPVPEKPSKTIVRDEDDRWVLASALNAKADVFITGDKDLLVLKDVDHLKIVTPRGFWEFCQD